MNNVVIIGYENDPKFMWDKSTETMYAIEDGYTHEVNLSMHGLVKQFPLMEVLDKDTKLKEFPIHSIPPSNFHPKSMRIKVVSR
jgi:hypothetical protein